MPHYILTLTCQDRPGIIHAVAGALLDVSANVLEQAQFTDQDSGLFAMRTRFEAPDDDAPAVRRLVEERTAQLADANLRLERLSYSDAYMVIADLDDLVGETRPHNLPGRVVPEIWCRRREHARWRSAPPPPRPPHPPSRTCTSKRL